MSSLGLYVHLPFCPQRCPYCGFAAVTGVDHLHGRYAAAVMREIEQRGRRERPFDTVFLGGGTPARMAPALIGRILEAADRSSGIAAGAEVTVEANPTSADLARYRQLRAVGCTRLSLGVQSFGDRSLRVLGRAHTALQAERAFAAARQAGFAAVSLDLIFSIPGAPPEDWAASLERTVHLGPDHVSTYALTVEEGTPLAARQRRGELPAVAEEEDAAAYDLAGRVLGEAGYERYEVSNLARPGFRCRHNWSCWMGDDYLGVGLAAHSHRRGRRWWNTPDMEEYLSAVESGRSAEAGHERLRGSARRREAAWLRLRTAEGLPADGEEVLALRRDPRVAALIGRGLARVEPGVVRLTPAGFAVADPAAACIADALAEARPAARALPAAAGVR